MAKMIAVLLFAVLLNSMKAAAQLSLKVPADSMEKKFLLRPLPQNFYNQQLGFFCKKELLLQKRTLLPLFFRLGSKEYVDYLENKPNALKRY
jgi:hypothetical protein